MNRSIGFVVADGRPERPAAKPGLVNIEDGGLIFRILAIAVRVVAEHQPYIRLPAARVGQVGVAHLERAGLEGLRSRAAIAQSPDARRLGVGGRGNEIILRASYQV